MQPHGELLAMPLIQGAEVIFQRAKTDHWSMEMKHGRIGNESELREAAQIRTLISDLDRIVQILNCDIATEEDSLMDSKNEFIGIGGLRTYIAIASRCSLTSAAMAPEIEPAVARRSRRCNARRLFLWMAPSDLWCVRTCASAPRRQVALASRATAGID
jgi:hypothetical protein